MKTLVTGGGGFIGSNLVRALLERGDDVRVLDNFSTGHRGNLTGLDVEVVEGELRSYERVHNATRGVEVVFHLGALGSVPRSVQDPLTSNAVNVEGTLNVLLAARYAARAGGYTRIIKTGFRPGDAAEMAMIELVDFNELYTQNKNAAKSAAPKKRTRRAGSTAPKKTAAKKEAPETKETKETKAPKAKKAKKADEGTEGEA